MSCPSKPPNASRFACLFARSALLAIALAIGYSTAGCSAGNQQPLPQLSLRADMSAPAADAGPPPGQHPLDPALDLAQQVLKNIDSEVRDYTATLVKQERIGSFLKPTEICFVKVRSKPFSVYMKFLAPDDLKGQEVIYVEGANGGNMIAHAGSGLRALAGTVEIDPRGPVAMLGQRYPITELGIENLARRLLEVGGHDRQYGECFVWMNDDAKVGDRQCISITVMHPAKRRGFLFHIARIYVDKRWMVPLHYEAYDWPAAPGGPPPLLESYTYARVKTNVGLTDADFDPQNPQYNFVAK